MTAAALPQPSSPADLSTATLLVVDGKTLFRDMVRSAFLTQVRGIREAASVDKAVEILTRHTGISCVVTDWDIMPTGGLELLRMIRAKALPGVSPQLPVVILTARADAAAVKTAMELDVNGFAATPLSLEKLRATICGALERSWLLQQPGHYATVEGVVPHPPRFKRVAMQRVEVKPAPFGGRVYGRRGEAPRTAGARGLKNVRMCILDDVSPGVVLARDLCDRDGHMLAPSGTELKPGVLQHLKNVGYALADSYCVWVGER